MRWAIDYFEQENGIQPAEQQDLKKAFAYWTEYLETRLVSPPQERNDE